MRLFLMPLGLGVAVSPSQAQIAQMVADSANRYGVPVSLALGIAAHESGFNAGATNRNTNGTTDWGVMQLNDVTVKTLGVADPLDPQQNIDAGVGLLGKYLSQYGGDTQKALWAYASGPGAVQNGTMNSTASQFIGYVEGYSPPAGLVDASGGTDTTIPDYSSAPAVNPFTGEPDPSQPQPAEQADIGLIAGLVLAAVAGVVLLSKA